MVDRIKEIIITAGLNVYPSEVESALREHPSGVDLAVVGLPGDDGGELVVAAVVLLQGSPLDLDGVRAYAMEALAAYKVPRRFVVGSCRPIPWQRCSGGRSCRSSATSDRTRRLLSGVRICALRMDACCGVLAASDRP